MKTILVALPQSQRLLDKPRRDGAGQGRGWSGFNYGSDGLGYRGGIPERQARSWLSIRRCRCGPS